MGMVTTSVVVVAALVATSTSDVTPNASSVPAGTSVLASLTDALFLTLAISNYFKSTSRDHTISFTIYG